MKQPPKMFSYVSSHLSLEFFFHSLPLNSNVITRQPTTQPHSHSDFVQPQRMTSNSSQSLSAGNQWIGPHSGLQRLRGSRIAAPPSSSWHFDWYLSPPCTTLSSLFTGLPFWIWFPRHLAKCLGCQLITPPWGGCYFFMFRGIITVLLPDSKCKKKRGLDKYSICHFFSSQKKGVRLTPFFERKKLHIEYLSILAFFCTSNQAKIQL